ncbi:MAG: ABC transporter permease subunit [Thermoplasmata archaeon]
MNYILLIILATLATSGRVLGLVLFSIVSGWFLAYAAIKGRIFENIFIAVIEVFESVPVISFFPIVLVIFITRIGGPLGVELASDFLVFTAVVWNIWMGEYQAFKTVPKEMMEVTENYRMGIFSKMRHLLIPFSVPRIAANLFPSVSDGFFYITVSEVFAIGLHTYQTFGIGSVLDSFLAANNTYGIDLSLIILGIIIGLIIVFLRKFSEYAVSRYTLDTDAPVIRRGRLNLKQTTRALSEIASNPFRRLAVYYRFRNEGNRREPDYEKRSSGEKYGRYIWGGVGIVLLALILYGAVGAILTVPHAQWKILLDYTPNLLWNLVYDYARVLTIVVISFIISIFLGYYLAVNRHAEKIGVPVVQVFSAYPAPIYFPFLYIITLPFMIRAFGTASSELYVLFLGFISTFYYAFYSFWMGVKALPSEYWEVMRNMNLGFFKKMRMIILPSTFPYMISGISSTINSAWGGLMIGEYWPDIYGTHTLTVHTGLMKVIDIATSNGDIMLAAWSSFIFGIVVVIYSIVFTRRMMDLARKRYVAEEGIFAA